MKTSNEQIESAYAIAREQYDKYNIDIDSALKKLAQIQISIQCWQGDDVAGFENIQSASGGGIQATGNYPGRARNADELRGDLEMALSLIPGTHRLNLHAMYSETGGKKVERDQLFPEHFSKWIEWAKEKEMGIDFNPTFFAHPRADSGFTLASYDKSVRRFWIDHGIACRKIGEHIGRELSTACVTNFWIPDGFKDTPADQKTPRLLLKESLDEIFKEYIDPGLNLDSVESKLFGIGSESYVVGSHEFYLGYAIKNNKVLCLDSGHFHPTETIADKISSVLTYLDEILLHVSRGVRWDSDHIVILSDEIYAIARELVRGGFLNRSHIGLDFFDASVNRVVAWIVGTRSTLKALLFALLEPYETLRNYEIEGDFTSRLALMEEIKTLPFGIIWDYYCYRHSVPSGLDWLEEVREYEKNVLSQRG